MCKKITKKKKNMMTESPSNQRTNFAQMDLLLNERSTPRFVKIIGGIPFEAFIWNKKRYHIPFLCDSCSDIRDVLVDISDKINTDQSNASSTSDFGANFLCDPDVSEWSSKDPIFTEYFNSGFSDIFIRKSDGFIGDESKRPKAQKVYTGFRGSKIDNNNATSDQRKSSPVTLKYSNKYTSPYREEEAESDFAEGIPEKLTSRSKSDPFCYSDTRLIPTNKSYAGEHDQNLNRSKRDVLVWNRWKKLEPIKCQEDDTSLHLGRYKMFKDNSRKKKAEHRLNRLLLESKSTVTTSQFPDSFKSGWEFWEAFNAAHKRHQSMAGRGYVKGFSIAPAVDLMKESGIKEDNPGLVKKQDDQKQKSNSKEIQVIRSLGMKHRKNQTQESGNSKDRLILQYPALKGRMAPKHFMDAFDTLRVRTSGGKIITKKDIKKLFKGDFTAQRQNRLTIKPIEFEE